MKKETKRFLALLLSLAMVFTMNVPSFAENVTEAQVVEAGIGDDSPETEISDGEVSDNAVSDDSVSEDVVVAEVSENEVSENEVSGNEVSENAVGDATVDIEINQGLSNHLKLDAAATREADGGITKMNDFVAKKQTAVMFMVPGGADSNNQTITEDAAKAIVANYKLSVKAVVDGNESESEALTADASNITLKSFYDKDSDTAAGWMAVISFPEGPDKGTYNFHLFDNGTEVGTNNGVNFYETKTLNILAVPVTGYWSKGAAPEFPQDKIGQPIECDANSWGSTVADVKTYLKDVYPIADINIVEGKTLDAGTAEYDMCSADGQKKLWEEANKLQTKDKETGKDKYDLILAFVMYRQDENGSGQGYTFGRPTNIITLTDKDMLPTVAHEIAHCYQVGDEYDGGSLNSAVNFAPVGYKGRDFVSGEENTTSAATGDYWSDGKLGGTNAENNGAGTVIYPSLHPYKLSTGEFVHFANDKKDPTISYMGSGYAGSDNYYWTSSLIWEHLFKELLVKEKKTAETNTEENAGASVSDDSLFNDSDFYFDDDYRFGESRMVEVHGYIDRAANGSVSVDMMPMFSYDGDLSYLEDNEEGTGNTEYTFAAVGADGKIIQSPVDGALAVYTFKANWYNAATRKMQDFVSFDFDAEYPKGTEKVVIFTGKTDSADIPANTQIWEEEVSKVAPKGGFTTIDVNDKEAYVEWEYTDTDTVSDNMYTEVYYAPQGDKGEVWFVGSSDDDDMKDSVDENGRATNGIRIDTSNTPDGYGWSKDAYVWVAVTDGINTMDLYSDESFASVNTAQVKVKGAKNGGFTYTGSEITPALDVVAYDGQTGKNVKLVKDVDYTAEYNNNINAGTATVTVTGIGEYIGGSSEAEFEIFEKNMSKASLKIDAIPDVGYQSDAALMEQDVKDNISVWDGNNELTLAKDYTISYNGVKKLTVPAVAEWEDSTYPVKVTLTGKGNYEGIAKKTAVFEIVSGEAANNLSASANQVVITLKDKQYYYTGKPIKAQIKEVKVGDTTLKSKYYKVVCTNNKNAGTATLRIVGKKGYYGSAKTTFTIQKKQITAMSVGKIAKQYYTGVSINNLPIVVKAGGIKLTKDVDYTVTYAGDFINASVKGQEPTFTVQLKADSPNFTWKANVKDTKKTITKKYTINKVRITNSAATSIRVVSMNSVSANTQSIYPQSVGYKFGYYVYTNGTEIPKNCAHNIVITSQGQPLVEGTDYVVTNTKAKVGKLGIITIKATGKNCTGTKRILFKVVQE